MKSKRLIKEKRVLVETGYGLDAIGPEEVAARAVMEAEEMEAEEEGEEEEEEEDFPGGTHCHHCCLWLQ